METRMKVLDYDGLRSKGIKWSKPHLWRLERARKFPKRIRLGEHSHGWLESEIDEWILALTAGRDSDEEAA
jgi:prophage regulatory protein